MFWGEKKTTTTDFRIITEVRNKRVATFRTLQFDFRKKSYILNASIHYKITNTSAYTYRKETLCGTERVISSFLTCYFITIHHHRQL